jgi:hypothetical protein
MKTTYSAERLIAAPAATIYESIANYRDHHRPGGFLPPQFSDLVVHGGGVGAGTDVSWVLDLGGRRRAIRATISEPEPGRRLVETSPGIETTFSVEPTPRGTRVRFTTVLDEPGLRGILTRLFARRLLAPVYADELERLDAYVTRGLARAA